MRSWGVPPLEVRCDSYVAESHVETPHDVRILRDSVLKSMRIAFQAFENLGPDTYDDLTGWRQIQHLRGTLGNADLAIHTSQKRAKYPELIPVSLSLCFARIKKCHLVLDQIRKIDPESKWISRLETAIGQFERQMNLVHRRLMDGERIPNAEKLLSLHAEDTRWCRKGKRYPNEVEWGVPVCVLEEEHRLILGWEIMWTESDVEMTVPLATKYTELYSNIASIRFDLGFWSPGNFDAVSGLEVHVILPKKREQKQGGKRARVGP